MSDRTGEAWVVRRSVEGLARRVVRWTGPLIALCGARPQEVRHLLTLRLLLDAGRAESPGRRRVPWRLLVAAAVGAAVSGIATRVESGWVGQLVVQTVAFALMSLLGIGRVGRLFTDSDDLRIAAHRPVAPRGLFIARFLSMLLSFGGPAWWFAVAAAAVSTSGAGGPLLGAGVLLATMSTTITSLGVVVALHAVVQRLGGRQGRRRLALWTQVGTALALAAVIRLASLMPAAGADFDRLATSSAMWFWPPAHAASLAISMQVAVASPGADVPRVPLGSGGVWLALFLPLVALVAALRTARLTLSDEEVRVRHAPADGAASSPLLRWPELPRLARRFAPPERAGFGLAWALSTRDTVFLQAVLPALGILVLVVTSNIVQSSIIAGRASGFDGLGVSLIGVYLLGVHVEIVSEAVARGELRESAWVFRNAPVARLAPVLRGCVHAVALRWYVPAVAVAALALVVGFGFRAVPHGMAALSLSGAAGLVATSALHFGLPFTRSTSRRDPHNGLVHFAAALLALMLGVSHFFVIAARPSFGGADTVAAIAVILASVWGGSWAWRRLARVRVDRDIPARRASDADETAS